jgi:hypothetical protein
MSYEIVRGIKVEVDKVLVDCASNNVYPRDYGYQEFPYFTKILKEKGREAVDIAILETYESGSFQGGQNKYTRALKVARHLPEYERFNWRRSSFDKDDEINKRRDSQEFKDFLAKALKTRLPADKFILSKDWCGTPVYLLRFGGRSAKWTPTKERAKIYKYAQDAEGVKACFTNSDDWKVEQVK